VIFHLITTPLTFSSLSLSLSLSLVFSAYHGSQISSIRNTHLHRAGGSRFHSLLLSVLHNQRRRHILVHDSESGKRTKTLERQAVDDADVKEFLLTPNHPGPTYVWNTVTGSSEKYAFQLSSTVTDSLSPSLSLSLSLSGNLICSFS
jgi:hypothetical protein